MIRHRLFPMHHFLIHKPYDVAGMFMNNIARLLLQVYFAACAALPLSYIHIEDTQGTHYFVAGTAHQGQNVHVLVLLHEIFFTHFSNRSDHRSPATSDGILCTAAKNVLHKTLFTSSSCNTFTSTDPIFSSVPNSAITMASVDSAAPPTTDFRSLSSGLSPPAV